MAEIEMTFGDLAATAREGGFEVTDLDGLAVNEEMQSALEDDGVWNEIARVDLREVPRDADRAVVADVSVGDQRFLVVGDGRNAEELGELLRGTNRTPYSP